MFASASAVVLAERVVQKVDRLSRSLLDFARLMELFEQHQVAGQRWRSWIGPRAGTPYSLVLLDAMMPEMDGFMLPYTLPSVPAPISPSKCSCTWAGIFPPVTSTPNSMLIVKAYSVRLAEDRNSQRPSA